MAFFSVRVPENVRNRMKAVAAQRGVKLQALVGGLLERFLDEAERRPPELADVLQRLRAAETLLRERGIAAVWVFGSVAQGEARPDSDVDLAIEFAPTRSRRCSPSQTSRTNSNGFWDARSISGSVPP